MNSSLACPAGPSDAPGGRIRTLWRRVEQRRAAAALRGLPPRLAHDVGLVPEADIAARLPPALILGLLGR